MNGAGITLSRITRTKRFNLLINRIMIFYSKILLINACSNSGYIDKVIKLAELREKGLLSEAEFEKMKEDLLK